MNPEDEAVTAEYGEEVTLKASKDDLLQKESPVKRVTMAGPNLDGTADVPVMENSFDVGNSFESQQAEPCTTTKIERLMLKIEKRRDERMEVSFHDRKQFIDLCLKKVADLKGTKSSGIPIEELVKMRDEQKHGGELHRIFKKAVLTSEEVHANAFYFRDFNEYYLTLKETYFRRNPLIAALVGVVAYYIVSIILFCAILGNNSTCPRTNGDPSYAGWLTALYFASVTISTVGYGDVSVIGSGEEVWRVLIGTLYMIFAMIVAVTVFSSLSSKALEFSADAVAPKLETFLCKFTAMNKSKRLSSQLRKVWTFKVFGLSLFFLLINIFGMCIAMIVMATTEEGDKIGWSWMTAFYWAVQTTTTIGYGDLDMPFELRWFNAFFAIIGTTFAASLLSSLADLKSEMKSMRTLYVWENREVSLRLIADMESVGDNQLDEYEFLLASLITLGKIEREDVTKIMNKFQQLAGEDHVIDHADIEAHIKRSSHRPS